MELSDFLELLQSIKGTIEPMRGMTGDSNCDTCDGDVIQYSVKVLEVINKNYILKHKLNDI